MLVTWCSAKSRAAMIAEANRAYPTETGGILMGYWARPNLEAVVTRVIGPGPNAIHTPVRFVPDTEYQERKIAEVYARSGRLETYLGDWHTHPGSSCGKLSRQDRRTLRRIAGDPAA